VNQTYDLVIIGAGSAGLTTARFAVQLGRKAALVEKGHVGGDCTWTACVPSKVLLKAARVAHDMRHADLYGIGPAEPSIDLKIVMGQVRSVIEVAYQLESPEALRAEGIDVYLGEARFVDPHTIFIRDTPLTAQRVVIATGAQPLIPPIDGLNGIDYLTYETVWDLEAMPGICWYWAAAPSVASWPRRSAIWGPGLLCWKVAQGYSPTTSRRLLTW
jgi:pyruvate/2-oxoglutarate dehydrogenase complex dihydrolipoamide dehydrogenase (E3) component